MSTAQAVRPAQASAIVFAYHQLGVRCLRVLLDAGVDVRLVVTHQDAPGEAIWFDSVAALAQERGLRCIAPADPADPQLLQAARSAAPDFLFSFYYRRMLGAELLAVPARGAFNMHGSLLPKYRGRVPVNWAVLHGERETGATLHAMHVRPDSGPVVDQCAVPILGDDRAREVFDKVVVAAEIVLARSLPRLLAGNAELRPQDLRQGSYFGARKPEDGLIPATAGGLQIHNLVRALSPPYPGAFFLARGHRIAVHRTLPLRSPPGAPGATFRLEAQDGTLLLVGADGLRLRVLDAVLDGTPLDADRLVAVFGEPLAGPDP